jgi:hypothetical protein
MNRRVMNNYVMKFNENFPDAFYYREWEGSYVKLELPTSF